MNISMLKGMVLVAASLSLSACTLQGTAKYFGAGELPSTGSGKAIIKVDADTCDGNENAKGSFSYVEKGAVGYAATGGVTLTGTIEKAGICTNNRVSPPGTPTEESVVKYADCSCPGWPVFNGRYTSSNPSHPGSGKYFACFYNQREGMSPLSPDTQLASAATIVERIVLLDGPYKMYAIAGSLRGSIKSSSCGVAPVASIAK